MKDRDTMLGKVVQMGGEARTVQKVMGSLLQTELDFIITQLSNCDPDLGTYAKLAGRAQTIRRLQNTLSMRVEDGDEALVTMTQGGK